MANLLGLGSSLYSIQIFNRYVGYGLDGTLVTLTIGAILAIAFEFIFRAIRARLVTGLFTPQDATAHSRLLKHLLTARNDEIVKKPGNYIFSTLKQQQQQQSVYSAQNLLVLLDFPFALLFIFCVFLLQPVLGVVVVLLSTAALVMVYFQYQRSVGLQQQILSSSNALDGSLSNGAQHSAVAAFNGQSLLLSRHRGHLIEWLKNRKQQTESQQVQQNSAQLVSGCTSVAIIGVGAVAVTTGNMDIGSLIGANILSMRAITVINQAGRVWQSLGQGEALEAELEQAWAVPEEKRDGAEPSSYAGKLALKGITHSYDPKKAPILNNLNLNLEAGEVIAICGVNGTGKTTIAKIVTGLIEPTQGQVLIDGVDLRQISIDWWRRNVVYVPQEPTFLNLSLRDNLTVLADVDDEILREAVRECGLQTMVDQHPDGLEQQIRAGGLQFPPGIRKRLALARGLLADGKILILDEAHEGMDIAGKQVLTQVLHKAAAAGKTIILFSSDKSVVTDAAHVFDLNTGTFTPRKGVSNGAA